MLQSRDKFLLTMGSGRQIDKKRSFGSFFGPSEAVVTKRVRDEKSAREEARQAKANLEAEQRRLAKSSSAKGKPSTSSAKPSHQKAPKPLDKDAEKARILKEARNYNFLKDDSPLPNKVEVKASASSKPEARHYGSKLKSEFALIRTSNDVSKTLPIGGTRSSERPPASSKPLPSGSKSLQSSHSHWAPSQSPRPRNASDRAVPQSKPKVSSSMPSAGPIRTDLKKEANLKEEAMLRKMVAGVPTTNGNRSSKSEKLSLTSQPGDRKISETLDRRQANPKVSRPGQATNRQTAQVEGRRPAQTPDRRPTQTPTRRPGQTPERRPGQTLDRRPAQAPERRPAQAPDRRHAQTPDKRPAQAQDRRPLQTPDKRIAQVPDRQPAKATDRNQLVSQGLKKGASGSSTQRIAVSNGDTRQRMVTTPAGRQAVQPKSGVKGAAKPSPSNHNREREKYSDARKGSIQKKRARSSSEDSDERPRYKKEKTGRVGGRGWRSLSDDDDDDSFIDDDDDQPNYSSMIQKMFGSRYKNRCQDDDDSDDGAMEVGFHQIQAEERKSAREARMEDEEQRILIEAEEKAERLRKLKKKKRKQGDR